MNSRWPVPRSKPVLLGFLSFALILWLCGCSGPPKKATWNNATGAEQYERLMWQAVSDKDWKSFEHRLAPAFVGVDSSGKGYDRAGWVEHWKNAALREYSISEVTVQPEGADMVVSYLLITGLTTGPSATAPGSGERNRVVSVWQQVKSGWILTACSLTPSKPQ